MTIYKTYKTSCGCEQLKARQILRPVGFFPRSRGLCMRLPSQATIWKLEKFYTKHARNNVSKNKIHTMFMVIQDGIHANMLRSFPRFAWITVCQPMLR